MKWIWKLSELPVAEHAECVGFLHGLIKYNQLQGMYRSCLAIIFNLCQNFFMNGGSLKLCVLHACSLVINAVTHTCHSKEKKCPCQAERKEKQILDSNHQLKQILPSWHLECGLTGEINQRKEDTKSLTQLLQFLHFFKVKFR